MTPHVPPFKSIYSQVYGKMRSEIVMVVFFYFLDWTSESRENLIIVRRWRGVMAMLITVALLTSDQRSQSLAMMEQISLSLLGIFIMMIVIDHCIYGWNFSGRTEHGNDVIFFLFLATVFGNLEVWKVKKWNIFLKYISAPV